MGFACYARFARCRAANLSTWARQVNLNLDGARRGLAVTSLTRQACAEYRPAAAFPEQQQLPMTAGPLGTADMLAEATGESDALAALIDCLLTMSPSELALLNLQKISGCWQVSSQEGFIQR
mmetsp:Transcript_118083/g.220739  ORF Transcript_118083/g.220739 Transcript_118083/m.220739 type:complete len:122 (-) Transcript_118083:141-506(-)